MANQIDHMDIKQILSLRQDGYSNRKIAATLGISRNTINNYVTLIRGSGIPEKDLLEYNEKEFRELFTIKTTIDNERYDELMQYFERVNLSRHQTGFTFLYHYNEYNSEVTSPYSYSQFMEHYNRRYKKIRGSMKLEHPAGQDMMIDYAGKHLEITDRNTGEIKKVEVFVAILPCSQYTYVEACESQKRGDLLGCIRNALQYYQGVPKAIISDNLKSAVTRSSKYEPKINRSLKDLAIHYNCVINPARAYSPQDKALVEHAVNLTYQRIYYPLRNMTFFSLKELNTEISRLLESYNDRLFQRKDASRKELYQSIERKELKPLPNTPYQMKEYKRAKVQKMGYVYLSTDKNYYSVPYRYIGKQTQIQYTNTIVEIYYNHDRIAVHKRCKNKGIYTTDKSHLSSSHQSYAEWSPEYFKKLAKQHGEFVMMFVDQIIAQANYPEIAYKRAMGVIQLHKKYNSQRLNNACQRALYGNALSYNRIKNILENNLDKEYEDIKDLNKNKPHIPKHENIRGANTYN